MRLASLASLALFPVLAGVAAACGSTVDPGLTGGTTGTGGTGGASTTTTTSIATTVSTGTGTGGGPDIGQPSNVYPAPHPEGPMVTALGGPVLATPKLYPIFFSNDNLTLRTKLEDFASKVGKTQYWAATTSEYGVGPITASSPIELTETATGPLDDASIQAWLAGKINGNDPAFPADPNGIFIIHYPAGVSTTITGGSGTQHSCQDFGGYHSNITVDGAHQNLDIAYSVIPRCGNFGQLSGVDAVTGTETHEIIEAVTDPFPMSSPDYATIDGKHAYWERFLGGGEVGDMCEMRADAFTKLPELPYTVQRTWSNLASKLGHEPCVPAPVGELYFNAVPVLNDNVKATVLGQTVYVKGVKIAVGKSRTIEIDLFSDTDTGGPWQVDVQELTQTPNLDLTLDQYSGQNGQKLHLTITVNSAGKNNTETFLITSTLGQVQHSWLGIVGS